MVSLRAKENQLKMEKEGMLEQYNISRKILGELDNEMKEYEKNKKIKETEFQAKCKKEKEYKLKLEINRLKRKVSFA